MSGDLTIGQPGGSGVRFDLETVSSGNLELSEIDLPAVQTVPSVGFVWGSPVSVVADAGSKVQGHINFNMNNVNSLIIGAVQLSGYYLLDCTTGCSPIASS